MLVYVVLFCLIVYVVLDQTGVLAEMANRFQSRGGRPADRRPDPEAQLPAGPDADRRLDVFEEFIEKLESGDNDDR